MSMITGKANISLFRLITLKHALRLEIMGMKRAGTSAYTILKNEYNLKGSKASVLHQVDCIINKKEQHNDA